MKSQSKVGDDKDDTMGEISDKSIGSVFEQIVSSSSLKTSDPVSSLPSQHQMVDEDSTSLVDLKTQLETKQKQLANLKREFSCLIRDLEKIERRVPNDWVLSPELSNVFRDVSIHNEIARIQKLVADNNLLRTQLCLLEKTRREFKDKIETKMEELFKEKLQLQIELNHVKKKLDETLASNGDLEEKLEKYRSKSREARSSLSDAITRIKSTISGPMDLDERKNSNFSLNESLLAYWELI